MNAGELRVFVVNLDAPDAELAASAALLSAEERARAERFRPAASRSEFVLTRAALRRVLAAALKSSPEAIAFARGRYGKPSLADSPQRVSFNVSHSYGRAAIAVALGTAELGIDVEQLRPMDDLEPIAARFFRPEEAAAIRQFGGMERVRAFFACWTMKEAYLKATGRGLSGDLNDCMVSLHDTGRPRLHARGETPWHAQFVPAGTEHVCALVYGGAPRNVNVVQVSSADSLPSLLYPGLAGRSE